MEQLNFLQNFPDYTSVGIKQETQTWLLCVDGASRNNPGLAGAGVYIVKNNIPIYKEGFFLGVKTNNQAEYLALLLGIFFLEQRVVEGDSVRIASDSELLVKQMNGLYKVKHPHLKSLHLLAKQKIHVLRAYIFHVLREENVQADEMANNGIDHKKALPADFVKLLSDHEIKL